MWRMTPFTWIVPSCKCAVMATKSARRLAMVPRMSSLPAGARVAVSRSFTAAEMKESPTLSPFFPLSTKVSFADRPTASSMVCGEAAGGAAAESCRATLPAARTAKAKMVRRFDLRLMPHPFCRLPGRRQR